MNTSTSVVASQAQANKSRDPNIACHKNAVNANVSATVAAGGTVKFQWTAWPHNIGPVLTYVAKCSGDCKDADKTALKFVKIDESGIDLSTQVWASGKLIADGNSWTTTVPKTLAPGMSLPVSVNYANNDRTLRLPSRNHCLPRLRLAQWRAKLSVLPQH